MQESGTAPGGRVGAGHAGPGARGRHRCDLVAEDLLRGSVAAGGSGTDRLVECCIPGGPDTGTEADPQNIVRAVVFIASATAPVHGATLVPRLAEGDAAAVLAWPGPGGEHADLAAALEVADAAGIPLLRLDPRADFRATSQLVATKVLAQLTHVLEYGTRVHRTLGDVFARGAGLAGLTETMARLSGTEVLVLSNVAGPLARSHSPRNGGLPRRGGAAGRRGPGGTWRCRRPCRGRVARGRRHAWPARRDAHPRRRPRLRPAGAPRTDGSDQEHDLAQHTVMSEQGVSLTGSESFRQQSIEAEERARNDFVHALLHNRFTDGFGSQRRPSTTSSPSTGGSPCSSSPRPRSSRTTPPRGASPPSSRAASATERARTTSSRSPRSSAR